MERRLILVRHVIALALDCGLAQEGISFVTILDHSYDKIDVIKNFVSITDLKLTMVPFLFLSPDDAALSRSITD